MRVPTKVDYGLRALIEIARHDSAISAEQIGNGQNLPSGYLQEILADLRRAGILTSCRGPAGGWLMAVDPEDVSVADVIRAVDGPLLSIHGMRPESVDYTTSARTLQLVWIAARSSMRSVFERVTIAALAADKLPADVFARTKEDGAWTPH
jgi:Rrf2 family protein